MSFKNSTSFENSMSFEDSISFENGTKLDFAEYVKSKPQLEFETDWDRENFDFTNHDFDDIWPPAYNNPMIHCRFLGRRRNQPIFDRFLLQTEGKVVVKLLETRLYEMAARFIFSRYCDDPNSIHFSKYNWLNWKKLPVKIILKALCSLFEQGNTLIVYNIHSHVIYGLLAAATYKPSGSEESTDELLCAMFSGNVHCEDRLEYILQTFDLESYHKISLLLVDPLGPVDTRILALALVRGFVQWASYCLNKSDVKCIVVHPKSVDEKKIYEMVNFATAKHNDNNVMKPGVLSDACFLIKILSYGENLCNQKFFGIIEYPKQNKNE